MEIMKVQLDPGAFLPVSAHASDAGYDLFAREDKWIPAHGCAVFDTGVHVQLPEHTAGIILPKSGLNIKQNILSFGVIDVGYSGSIVAKLYNFGDTGYYVKRGDKITQLVVMNIQKPAVVEVEKIDGGERGDNGFGSTGR